MPKNIQTRWASPENWDGAKGAAGQANRGRKGSACFPLKASEQKVLAQVTGRGRFLGVNVGVIADKATYFNSMPDGTDFISWERPAVFSRTLHVDAGHPKAG